MDFSFAIPRSSRTLVVVPTMLDSEEGIQELAEALEVRFLANRDAQLHFGLLTDFHDAHEERCDGDESLLNAARVRIEELNRKYREPSSEASGGDRFFLFHRPRLWNPREGVWMGYERKRGKLADLNALLRGSGTECFSLIVGDTAQLSGLRYVITLDADTQLPRDSARQFVATMAHPLNRPRYGGTPDSPRVVEGYGILQPRVGVSLTAASRTRYGRLFGGEPGIDPYTRAVSDVYQDLFREGSFIGKGIYDVDAFEHVLGGRLPENRILSHDLLEGCYARSGLLSDVELVEESPARYDADVKRRHRWIRGDWQIAGWLLPRLRMRVRDPQAPLLSRLIAGRNPLSTLSRLKILDNLRRSLTPAALTVTLLLGWAILQPPWLWTLAGLAVLFLPPLFALLGDLARKPDELDLTQHAAAAAPSALRGLGQAGLTLACLPYEAWFSLDAIARTVGRMWFTRRRLLEWQPSSEVARRSNDSGLADLVDTALRMWVGPVLALLVFAGLATWRPDALPAARMVLALWFVSPFLVWAMNRPLGRRQSALSAAQTVFVHRLARRTWAFFEAFVTQEDNFLPPDNIQEHPVQRVAHRTSPTNIGLSLLAALAARDFGYITMGQMIDRTTAMFDTMDRMRKYHGHWFNWYDTQTLQPLHPAYVSTVDSGNLAGHLLTLRGGLLLLADEAPRFDLVFTGLRDTLDLLREAAGGDRQGSPALRLAAQLEQCFVDPPDSAAGFFACFDALRQCARDTLAWFDAKGAQSPSDEARRWAQALL
ncbi:MAG TPA: cyclic beta 1-2 glucan synthetase, partial [Caldimonas sp.]